MCGLAGIFSFKHNNSNKSIIQKMTNAIAHRGPDAEGFFCNANIALGHRRLSIIDLSEAANQPLYDNTGDYVIVFNGEIYNYAEIKKQLFDYPFKTNGDTEVVLAAYIKWGAKALDYFNGMFAFAIFQQSTNTVFIAKDKLGVKPLYFFQNEEHFVFASEIRSILQSGLVNKNIDAYAMQCFLQMQSYYAPHTAIENIQQLENGNYLLIKENKIEKHCYWNITKPKTQFSFSDYDTTKQKVSQLLLQAVERRMVADVPVAAFLSGGIDSSAVVGLMSKLKSNIETFNIAFNEKEYDESAYAEIIAKKFNTNHHKIVLDPSTFLNELPNALNAMDIPSGDGINTYVVSKEIAKNGIKVALSGVGGDELFAGYAGFSYWNKLQQKKWIWNTPAFCRKIACLAFPNNAKFSRIKKLLQSNGPSIQNVYPLIREIVAPGNIQKIVKTDKQYQHNWDDASAFPIYSQYSIAELMHYTQYTLLKDTDQYSMAIPLEVREPFFDVDLTEYVLQIPDKYKTPTYPKKLMVEALGDLLPNEIVHRPKKGFALPWDIWMRNELSSFCKQKMESFAARNFVQEKEVLQMWSNFEKNNTTRWSEVWNIVLLEDWLSKNTG
jgi:asparagine synthase (glutamine-hydrolysing)